MLSNVKCGHSTNFIETRYIFSNQGLSCLRKDNFVRCPHTVFIKVSIRIVYAAKTDEKMKTGCRNASLFAAWVTGTLCNVVIFAKNVHAYVLFWLIACFQHAWL